MDLYFAPFACSLAARIVADEAGVPLSFRQVELYAKVFTDDGRSYLEAAPRGQVPVLRLDDGTLLTEVSAILQYLAAARPELLGTGTLGPYRVLEGLSRVATELHKRILAPLGSREVPLEVRRHARDSAPTILRQLADTLQQHPFLAGDHFTVADAYLVWGLQLARTFKLELGALETYLARVQQRPSVERSFAIELPLALAAWQRQKALVGSPPWLR